MLSPGKRNTRSTRKTTTKNTGTSTQRKTARNRGLEGRRRRPGYQQQKNDYHWSVAILLVPFMPARRDNDLVVAAGLGIRRESNDGSGIDASKSRGDGLRCPAHEQKAPRAFRVSTTADDGINDERQHLFPDDLALQRWPCARFETSSSSSSSRPRPSPPSTLYPRSPFALRPLRDRPAPAPSSRLRCFVNTFTRCQTSRCASESALLACVSKSARCNHDVDAGARVNSSSV